MTINELFNSTMNSLSSQYAQTAWADQIVLDGVFLLLSVATAVVAYFWLYVAGLDEARWLVVYPMGLLGSFLIYLAVSDTAPGPVARAFLSAMEVIPAALSSLAVKVFSPLLPFLRIAAVFLARIAVTFLTTLVGSAFVFFVASFSLCWAAAWSYVYFETIRHFCTIAAYNWDPCQYRLESLLNRLSCLEKEREQVSGKIRSVRQCRRRLRLSQPAVRTEVKTVQAARTLLYHSKSP